jgi:DNA replication protein DnaC
VLDFNGRVVDRRLELAELRAAVEAAERVSGGGVMLSGPPGVGKSTLTQAFGVENPDTCGEVVGSAKGTHQV